MNVFILDRSMEKSAQMLDDAHLKAQINEACQILMANYNKRHYPKSKIGHVGHTVTKFYDFIEPEGELFCYLAVLLKEYKHRFNKLHQNYFWANGFIDCMSYFYESQVFDYSKTYVDGQMTDDIEAIRKYISTKPMKKQPTWTNREKPDWWEI